MDLTEKKTLEALLEKHGTIPKKSLGQNFLLDKNTLLKICSSSLLSKKDTVIEIGPGAGTLTVFLAERVKKVIAVEKDAKMISVLKETLQKYDNVQLIDEDALSLKVKEKDYKVVANLPYCVASQVIRGFLQINNPPSLMTVMVQKEVAERIMAKPPKMNMLATLVQLYANVEKVKTVKRGSFWPSPNVDSAVIKIVPFKKRENEQFYETFFELIKIGYSHPRKQLSTNFSQFDISPLKKIQLTNILTMMRENEISTKRRAESLSVEEWKKITKDFLNE